MNNTNTTKTNDNELTMEEIYELHVSCQTPMQTIGSPEVDERLENLLDPEVYERYQNWLNDRQNKLNRLYDYQQKFEVIAKGKQYSQKQKNRKYANLMTDMEIEFGIDISFLLGWSGHPVISKEVIDLYEKISNARNFDIYD